MVVTNKDPFKMMCGRHMNKVRYKHCWELWRSENHKGRLNFLLKREWAMCWQVSKNRNTLDPLLVKHVKHVVGLECSQMGLVA